MSDYRSTMSSKCAGGDCLQVAFHKSSASSDSVNCVEVAGCTCNEFRVRDSKDPEGPVLVFTRDEWKAFVLGVKAGEFDV